MTCTSMFLLRRLGLLVLLPLRTKPDTSQPGMGGKHSLSGVTVAEGTEEVGVLDWVPRLLGVAGTEDWPDSDSSSYVVEGQVTKKEVKATK